MFHLNFIKKASKSLTLDAQFNAYKIIQRVLLGYVLPHIWTFIFSTLLVLVISGTTSLQAYLIQPALDVVFNQKDMRLLAAVPIAIMLVAIIKAVASYLQARAMSVMISKINFQIQRELYEHFIKSDMKLLNSQQSGTFLVNISNDSSGIVNILNVIVNNFIRQVATIIALLAVMLSQSVTLTLISLVAFPIAFGVVYRISYKLRNLSSHSLRLQESYMSQLTESLQYAKLVKSYNAEDYECKRFNKLTNELYQLVKRQISLSNINAPMMEMLGTVGVAAVIWYGGYQVMQGTTTIGTFFSFFGAALMLYKPIKSASGITSGLQQGLVCANRVFNVLDSKPTITDKPNALDLPNPIIGNIQLRNVNFSYSETRQTLKNINIEIKGGTTVAMVGHSGGGKSTIMNLISRFYEPSSGEITLDGLNIQDIKLHSLRSKMSLVSQEVELFNETVRENIRYSKEDATDIQIQRAAELAAADEFIRDLPNGYDTVVGPRGLMLSGGQRQRIAIARAFLYNAPILLLDEATSALDPISEKVIQNAIYNLMQNKTCVVIAHRLSTVIKADTIYVISNGEVVESGKHQDLIKRNGIYAQLYVKQLED